MINYYTSFQHIITRVVISGVGNTFLNSRRISVNSEKYPSESSRPPRFMKTISVFLVNYFIILLNPSVLGIVTICYFNIISSHPLIYCICMIFALVKLRGKPNRLFLYSIASAFHPENFFDCSAYIIFEPAGVHYLIFDILESTLTLRESAS